MMTKQDWVIKLLNMILAETDISVADIRGEIKAYKIARISQLTDTQLEQFMGTLVGYAIKRAPHEETVDSILEQPDE